MTVIWHLTNCYGWYPLLLKTVFFVFLFCFQCSHLPAVQEWYSLPSLSTLVLCFSSVLLMSVEWIIVVISVDQRLVHVYRKWMKFWPITWALTTSTTSLPAGECFSFSSAMLYPAFSLKGWDKTIVSWISGETSDTVYCIKGTILNCTSLSSLVHGDKLQKIQEYKHTTYVYYTQWHFTFLPLQNGAVSTVR